MPLEGANYFFLKILPSPSSLIPSVKWKRVVFVHCSYSGCFIVTVSKILDFVIILSIQIYLMLARWAASRKKWLPLTYFPPSRTFLRIPFISPASDAEKKINAAVSKTRVSLKQKLGVLKRRFLILHKQIIRSPATAVIYIGVLKRRFRIYHKQIIRSPAAAVIYNMVSCVVLHNICIDQGTSLTENKTLRRRRMMYPPDGFQLMALHIVMH